VTLETPCHHDGGFIVVRDESQHHLLGVRVLFVVEHMIDWKKAHREQARMRMEAQKKGTIDGLSSETRQEHTTLGRQPLPDSNFLDAERDNKQEKSSAH